MPALQHTARRTAVGIKRLLDTTFANFTRLFGPVLINPPLFRYRP